MSNWTKNELERIEAAEELEISTLRRDGTLRNPVTIWVVRNGDEIFVRAVKGRSGPWFRGVLTQHAGHISAGGLEKDVTFEEVADPAVITRVDEAYSSKYRRYPPYVAPLLTAVSRAATLKVVPR